MNNWTTEEDNFLREYYSKLKPSEIANRLVRPKEGVKRRAFRLGLTESITVKPKPQSKIKFQCQVMLKEGDMQPLVVKAFDKEKAKEYIMSKYNGVHKIVDISPFERNRCSKGYIGGNSIYGKWGGVKTTKHSHVGSWGM